MNETNLAHPLLREQAKSMIAPRTVIAYVEHKGNSEGDGKIYDTLIERLLLWAEPAKLWIFPSKTRLYMIYPDDPERTPEEQRRLWLGINVPEETEVSGEVRKMVLPETLCAMGAFEMNASEFGRAWEYLLAEWMPENGFLPAEGYCFEMQTNDSCEHPEHKHLVDIFIPAKRLL